MKKKIFVDFDDTIVDSTATIVDIYNQHYSESAIAKDIRNYDLLDQCPRIGESSDDNYQKEITDFYASDYFWANVKPKDHVIDVMNKLKSDGYEIVLVSYGNAANIARKVHYAHETFPMLDGYIFLSQHEKPFTKRDVNMEGCFFIDDYSAYLQESNAHVRIMFGKELKGNRNPGFFITGNWNEVYRYVTTIYEANKLTEPVSEDLVVAVN